jgi:agmatinase
MKKIRTYAGIEETYADPLSAAIYLQSIPYDGTSTWGKGADRGFEAFLEASENMELYDIETDSEVFRKGIHLLEEIGEDASPEAVFREVSRKTTQLLESGKFLSFFGGEHAVSIGIMEAFRKKYPELSVLQLDAHADLRPSYMGSEFNHACAMHRASQTCNLVQVGIRSMDLTEKQFVDERKCFLARNINRDHSWMGPSIDQLSESVYLSIDLDVLDPSIMPSTGTPEPGGMDWDTLMTYLKKVVQAKRIVGFDIVEFAPIPQLKSPDFLVAKLYYKLLSYIFHV